MSRKTKTWIAVLCLLVASIAFGRMAIVGGFVKWAVRMQWGAYLTYRSLQWDQGRLVFIDPVLFDGESGHFQIRADRIGVALSLSRLPSQLGVSLLVIKPHAFVFGKPHPFVFSSSNWLDLRLKVEDGFLEWAEMGLRAKMRMEKTSPQQLGRLMLEMGSSKIEAEAIREGNNVRVEASASHMDVSFLQPWIEWAGLDVAAESGFLDGWIHLESTQGDWKRGSAHLVASSLSYHHPYASVSCKSADIDWEGEWLQTEIPLFHLAPLGHFRFECLGGAVQMHDRQINGIDASFSYYSDLGVKWELTGIGTVDQESFPIVFEGRGFWPSHGMPWLDAELRLPVGTCCLHGETVEKCNNWHLQIHELQPPYALLFQEILNPVFRDWEWKEGEISAEASFTFANQKLKKWELKRCEVTNLIVCRSQNKDFHLGCHSFTAHMNSTDWAGQFSLNGGHGQFFGPGDLKLQGLNWNGSGTLAQAQVAASHWSGLLNDKNCEGSFSGGSNWKAEGICDRFQFLLEGEWKKKILEILSCRIEGDNLSWRGAGAVDLSLSGKAPFALSTDQWTGDLSLFTEHKGHISSDHFFCRGDLFNSASWNWELIASLQDGIVSLPNGIRLEQAKARLTACPDAWVCEEGGADLLIHGQKLHLECTRLFRENNTLSFDLRMQRGILDLVRLVGQETDGIVTFDENKTECLGRPLFIEECRFANSSFDKLALHLNLPWESLKCAAPLLQEAGWPLPPIHQIPLEGSASIRFLVTNNRTEIDIQGIGVQWKKEPFPFSLRVLRSEKIWRIEHMNLADFSFSFSLFKDQEAWAIQEGKALCQRGFSCQFSGKVDAQAQGQLLIADLLVQAAPLLAFFNAPSIEYSGLVNGQGCLTFDLISKQCEMDFDLTGADLKAGPFRMENRGSVHVFFSPVQGLIFKGVDVHAERDDFASIDCKIGLLQYDDSHWIFNHANVHLPGDLFPNYLYRAQSGSAIFCGHYNGPNLDDYSSEILMQYPSRRDRPNLGHSKDHQNSHNLTGHGIKTLDLHEDIDFIADIQCASDFSTLSCYMKEGFLPLGGELRHLQGLRLFWDEKRISLDSLYYHDSHCLKLGLQINRNPTWDGRLILEDIEHPLNEEERPLTIDWEYDDLLGVAVHSIEGSFGGVEASFHAESIADMSHLIGSARIHFGLLSELLPRNVAEVFTDLEMGKGYELKGHLTIGRKDLSQIFFRGILSGKQLELFGYQLRTLLGQVELGPEKMRIYDIKISDSAGILKIEEILMGGPAGQPWTLSIPLISILELRPSLLQKSGGPPGEISPLVVRDLVIRDFKGFLEDGNTYTATGELHFINSYKRGHTVFDIPSDLLGRIIGLDMDLLIPVCGTLRYELKDGAFHLTELVDAYSEGNRSEFFLVFTDESPTVDLDGNLNINVKMKQFVLFKLTEAFVISIDGKLNDPHYRLQKKKRFLGL